MNEVFTGQRSAQNAAPTAVVRVSFDEAGTLTDDDFRTGLSRLADEGLVVLGTERGRRRDGAREIEIVAELGEDWSASTVGVRCSHAFGVPATVGVVTFISRGTDVDALSVLRRFGVDGEVRRELDTDDEEIVTVTMSLESERRVPESRLQTALEAALNCEVRIERV